MIRTLLALALVALPITAQAQTAAQWVATGRALLDSGKNDAAVKAFEKAVKLDDASSMNHMLLAQALGQVARNSNVLKQGMLAPRIKREMERARDLDPRALDPHLGLIDFYLEAPGVMGGSVAKARLEAAEIAKLNKMRGRFAEARIAQHEKDSSAMERAYRAAVNEAPDSITAAGTLASYLISTKRTPEAFAVVDAYIARRPKDPMGPYYIGRLATWSGEQLPRGEAALRAYIALPPDTADKTRTPLYNAHFRLGELLVKKGDKAGARTEFNKSLALNPRYEPTKRAIAALR